MTSLQNSFPTWKSYPARTNRLSGIRLILPAATGMYGRPNRQIIITSNHQPSLVNLGEKDELSAFVLDGGGFPLKIAVAFNLLQPPESNFKIDDAGPSEDDIIYLIPNCLAAAWHWHDNEARLGGIIRIVSDNFPEQDSISNHEFSMLFARCHAGMRLAGEQILLMMVPVSVINFSALAPLIAIFFVGSLLLACLWTYIPGNGWIKGMIAGLVSVGAVMFSGIFHVLSFQPVVYVGIFISLSWLGGIFIGARDTT